MEKKKNLELFKRAISEGLSLKIEELDEEMKDINVPEPSREHKLEMNRMLREASGGSFVPFPEADEQN